MVQFFSLCVCVNRVSQEEEHPEGALSLVMKRDESMAVIMTAGKGKDLWIVRTEQIYVGESASAE